MKLTASNLKKALESDDTNTLAGWIQTDREKFDKIIREDHKSYFVPTVIKILSVPSLRNFYLDPIRKIRHKSFSEDLFCIPDMLRSEDVILTSEINKHLHEIFDAIFKPVLQDDDEFLRFVGKKSIAWLKRDIIESDNYKGLSFYYGVSKAIKIEMLAYILNHPIVFKTLICNIFNLSDFIESADSQFVSKQEYAKQAIENVLKDSELQTKILKTDDEYSKFVGWIRWHDILPRESERDIKGYIDECDRAIKESQRAIEKLSSSIKQARQECDKKIITKAAASLAKESTQVMVSQQSVFSRHKSRSDVDTTVKTTAKPGY